MKKSILIIGAMIFSAPSFAQCNITGKSTINVLSEESYSISDNSAQCKDCHLWVTIGNNATLLGDNKQNTVKVKANQGGRQILSLSVLTPQGLAQCSKNIDIVDALGSVGSTQAEPITKDTNCDIATRSFREVRVGDQVAGFYPDVATDAYRYTWTADYGAGGTMSSTDRTPQFPYARESGIRRVSVKIASQKCIKELAKTYDEAFWKFL